MTCGTKYDVLLFDLMNLYCRYYNGLPNAVSFVDGKRIPIQGLTGTIHYLHTAFKYYGHKNSRRVILADNFSSGVLRRQKIDPLYKSNREYDKEMFSALPYLCELIKNGFGGDTFFIQCPGYEADDLLPGAIELFLKEEKRDATFLMVSSDMDWARCLSDSVHWFDLIKVWTQKSFYEKAGFKPTVQNVIRYKAYRGDTADNIPVGFPGVRKQKLLSLIDYGEPKQVLDDLPIIDWMTPADRQKFRESFFRIQLNEKLVSFLPIDNSLLQSSCTQCSGNAALAKDCCDRMGLDVYSLFPSSAKTLCCDPDILF